MATINFTAFEAHKLKEAYLQAVKEQKPQFTALGHEFVTEYAKYLLQYLAREGIGSFEHRD